MTDIIFYLLALPVLFYVGIALGISMLTATMTEFAEYQNQTFQWPIWYIKALRTLLHDENLKKGKIISFFLFHLNDAIFVSMAAMAPPDIEEYISVSYEERARVMYLSTQPKGKTK